MAKRELQMDDDAYRSILAAKFQKESAADLGLLELEALVKHMKSCGFKAAAAPALAALPLTCNPQKSARCGCFT